MDTVSLLDLPHRNARSLLASGVPVYFPVNPVEYHGPHLSLHNDHLVGMALAADLHRRLARDTGWPFVVAASLEVGVEACPGPGTRDTPYLAAKALIEKACAALADLGAKRVVLTTFHGSPLHAMALDAGARLLERRGVRAVQPLNLLMEMALAARGETYQDALATVGDAEQRSILSRRLPLDFHAGFFETSVALHYVPETVGDVYRTLAPCPEFGAFAPLERASRWARRLGRARLADELAFAAAGLGWTALRPFPGYTSHPAWANAEAGGRFADLIVGRYLECVESVFAGGPPPRPILQWLERFTLSGRIPGFVVPLDQVQG